MTRDDAFYWAAILLVGAFVFLQQDAWLLMFGVVLALYGAAHGTLEKLTANKDGIVAQWQTRAIKEAVKARQAQDQLAISDSAEAKVTRTAEFTTDGILSPAEFVDVLSAVAPAMPILFQGGPKDGVSDSFPVGTMSIGANERAGAEVRAAEGAYLRTANRDSEGRVIFRWTPLEGEAGEAKKG